MRKNLLVHWTGRDITTDRRSLTDPQREAYVARLADILDNGLWMTKPAEKIHGANGSWIAYEAPMTCFTEVRLSETESHTQRYGLLGVVVNRQFVLDRFGGPVHYVRNHSTESTVGNVQAILDPIKSLSNPDLARFFAVNSAFLKAMSDENTDNWVYLNEQEWRIVQTDIQVDRKNIVKTGLVAPEYRVPLPLADVRLLVFPDDLTRKLALTRPDLTSLGQGRAGPPLLTIAECGEF